MVDFLLLIEKVIEYNKKSIDKGDTPLEIYKICSCIKETFCLSFMIRKSNNLFLFFQKEFLLIWFNGSNLRYLGSDERSQALLLLKAIQRARSLPKSEGWYESTPGIYISAFLNYKAFMDFFKNLLNKPIIMVIQHKNEIIINNTYLDWESIGFFEESLYIISFKNEFLEKLQATLKEMVVENIKYLLLPKIEKVEDGILFINYNVDIQNGKERY